MSKPEIKRTSGQYVSFQFSEGVDAKITIEIHEKYSREGRIESHVIYSSEEDKKYKKLVGSMARTAGLVIENNFADGKDQIETPEELSRQIDSFKALIWTFDREKGHQVTGRLLGNAKTEIFKNEQIIRGLTTSQQNTLEEILRWHVQEALNHQPGNINPAR